MSVEFVEVVCRRGHAEKMVRRFGRVGDSWEPVVKADGRQRGSLDRLRPRRDGRALLDEADRDFARVEWDDAEQRLGVSAGQSGDQLRTRWDIGCGICGDNVRARSERLDVVLDTLAEHGLGSISLSDVRATLNNVGRTT